MNDVYLLTVTVENLGRAGAEVPLTVKFAGGEVTKRVEVRGNSKGVIRVEIDEGARGNRGERRQRARERHDE